MKKVQADWKILENDLPGWWFTHTLCSIFSLFVLKFELFWQTETIFVRACESRMDILRAVIIGPEGTPYHDGLFFFDIQFPDTYPSVPPVCLLRNSLVFVLLGTLLMTPQECQFCLFDRKFITIPVGLESTRICTIVVKCA